MSELLSEIVEPISKEIGGGEVCSMEEALAHFDELNKQTDDVVDIQRINKLRTLSGVYQTDICEEYVEETLTEGDQSLINLLLNLEENHEIPLNINEDARELINMAPSAIQDSEISIINDTNRSSVECSTSDQCSAGSSAANIGSTSDDHNKHSTPDPKIKPKKQHTIDNYFRYVDHELKPEVTEQWLRRIVASNLKTVEKTNNFRENIDGLVHTCDKWDSLET